MSYRQFAHSLGLCMKNDIWQCTVPNGYTIPKLHNYGYRRKICKLNMFLCIIIYKYKTISNNLQIIIYLYTLTAHLLTGPSLLIVILKEPSGVSKFLGNRESMARKIVVLFVVKIFSFAYNSEHIYLIELYFNQ